MTYRTSELARKAGIHVNTVRFYERIGVLSAVPRAPNGYRLYDERHLCQLLVCRQIYPHGWLGRALRRASKRVISALVRWELDEAAVAARDYLELIRRERSVASRTVAILRRWGAGLRASGGQQCYSRKQAAELVGVTPETLRAWERSGLLRVPRHGPNRERRYGEAELERLRVIYMLRQASFAVTAIHRALRRLDDGAAPEQAAAALDEADEQDVSYVSVGDRWQVALAGAELGAEEIIRLIEAARQQRSASS